MRGPVCAQPTRVCQRARIAPIRLHPPAPGRVHRREIRIRHDHLVAQCLQRLRDPFALGRCLKHHPRAIPSLEERREPLPARAHTALHEHSPVVVDDADLALPLMDVDPDVLHGWPPFAGRWGRGLPLEGGDQPLHPIYLPSAFATSVTTFSGDGTLLFTSSMFAPLSDGSSRPGLPGAVLATSRSKLPSESWQP